MTEKIDFVKKSTKFVSTAKTSESEIVINDQYKIINKKMKLNLLN